MKSIYLTSYKDHGTGKFKVCSNDLPVRIIKAKNSKLIIDGICRLESHLGGNAPIVINLEEGSIFEIRGDFIIGHGVRIHLSKGAKLVLGGRDIESASGITCDSLIMVNNKIAIGKDFICAWNVYITDCDWHQIEGQDHTLPVEIGNHVWIANNCVILKGTTIGQGCIVASQSKLMSKRYPENTLLAGVPAKVVRDYVVWHRDMK